MLKYAARLVARASPDALIDTTKPITCKLVSTSYCGHADKNRAEVTATKNPGKRQLVKTHMTARTVRLVPGARQQVASTGMRHRRAGQRTVAFDSREAKRTH
jgi:hypothetical protein